MVTKINETEQTEIQDAVNRFLGESDTLSDAASGTLNTLLDAMDWSYGALWCMDHSAEVIQCYVVCQSNDRVMSFAETRKEKKFVSGEGLPGKVFASGTAEVAQDEELQGAGFPVMLGDKVVGVLEFFHTELPPPDQDFCRMMVAIGKQLGLVLKYDQIEQQARQSQKMEAIGRLAGGIAHDFNNMLNLIIGNAHLISRKLEPESPIKKNIDQIQQTGNRAAALIQELLSFRQNQTLQLSRMKLNEIIGHLEPMLRQMASDQIVFSTDLEPSDDQVLMDRTQLEQVITNLVVNARDAMPEGGTLTMTTKPATLDEHEAKIMGLASGQCIRLDIQDTGQGMDESVLAKIFEPFFTTKEKGKGTGLGLATVYRVVSQSGGTIRVSSQVGQGTTFSIYLPILKLRRPERQQPAAPAPDAHSGHIPPEPPKRNIEPETPVSAMPKPVEPDTRTVRAPSLMARTHKNGATDDWQTILVVDDEPDLRFITGEFLKNNGYDVVQAANGPEALERLETGAKPIDLVLTDLAMPGMNGLELIDKVQAGYPELPVVVMSGSSDRTLLESSIFDGDIPLLKKPFNLDELLVCIRETLEQVKKVEAPSTYRTAL